MAHQGGAGELHRLRLHPRVPEQHRRVRQARAGAGHLRPGRAALLHGQAEGNRLQRHRLALLLPGHGAQPRQHPWLGGRQPGVGGGGAAHEQGHVGRAGPDGARVRRRGLVHLEPVQPHRLGVAALPCQPSALRRVHDGQLARQSVVPGAEQAATGRDEAAQPGDVPVDVGGAARRQRQRPAGADLLAGVRVRGGLQGGAVHGREHVGGGRA